MFAKNSNTNTSFFFISLFVKITYFTKIVLRVRSNSFLIFFFQKKNFLALVSKIEFYQKIKKKRFEKKKKMFKKNKDTFQDHQKYKHGPKCKDAIGYMEITCVEAKDLAG